MPPNTPGPEIPNDADDTELGESGKGNLPGKNLDDLWGSTVRAHLRLGAAVFIGILLFAVVMIVLDAYGTIELSEHSAYIIRGMIYAGAVYAVFSSDKIRDLKDKMFG